MAARSPTLTLALSGDVMTGRGIDQVLAHPSDPRLDESFVRDARDYVRLAERVNGPIPSPVDDAWPWGDALDALDTQAPDVRIVDLETSITTSDDDAPGKAVRYRMQPANVGVLTVAGVDCCVLANNHVLDFGPAGLIETLDVLQENGIRVAGAGRTWSETTAVTVLPVDDGRRVLVVAAGSPTSGIPSSWAARPDRPGVAHLPRLSRGAAEELCARADAERRPGDVLVASLHWGSNWGHEIPDEQVRFAHWLVDGGFHVVHGHSSHHPRPIEVYRDRLILYGCGDLINDYEGIGGYEALRPELRLLHLPRIDTATGTLVDLTMIPLRARRFRLERCSRPDAAWLARTLTAASARFGTRIDLAATATAPTASNATATITPTLTLA